MPVVFLATVYAGAIIANISLGHWPIPSLNDPASIVTWGFYDVSVAVAYLTNVALYAAPGMALANWRVLRVRSRYWVWLACWAVGVATFLLLLWTDPGSVMEWWFD